MFFTLFIAKYGSRKFTDFEFKNYAVLDSFATLKPKGTGFPKFFHSIAEPLSLYNRSFVQLNFIQKLLKIFLCKWIISFYLLSFRFNRVNYHTFVILFAFIFFLLDILYEAHYSSMVDNIYIVGIDVHFLF